MTEEKLERSSTSFDLVRAITLNPDIPATKKLILIVIATHANDDLVSFPSYEKICEITGYCLQTVANSVAWIKDSGLPITISKRRYEPGSGWKHNVYMFTSADDIASWTSENPEPEDGEDPFDKFWEAYPRKVGKVQARKAFKKIKRRDLEAIIADIEARKARFDQWKNPQYIVYPERYIKYELWNDEWDTGSASGGIDISDIMKKYS